MDYTPKMLKEIGLKNKPIFMTYKHLNNILTDKNSGYIREGLHSLTKEEVAEAPIILAHPAIIAGSLKNDGSILVISEGLNKDDEPIQIILSPNGYAVENFEKFDSNFMKSMYGKGGFYGYLRRLIDNNKIMYINEKKIQLLSRQVGVQFSSLLKKVKSFDTIIQNYDDVVNSTENNSNNLNSTEKYSLKEDSEGRKLSEQQQEFFKNSKAVDENGYLQVVYHGTVSS